ncbi:hypothetical protein CONPUDRAFT_60488 [Coniophora puteana RWD-64-598 SS2]|uniref:Uncharacterized protein n=1 Tax=Coniophora puteana (strain RWD-64-598) TaxID=741705 RepID=A0A5M3MH46_CONPW|nr:uncharacterized protein CONPUDRAFT_60488 [Coniophora puteana RWD-64-598 SS2]EIW78542.1 hypothetical protein CONPUDRAFT_60488 [Coniophora puteana RWD-64-598 SS2]
MSSEKGKEKAHSPSSAQHLSLSSGAPQTHPCFAHDVDLTSAMQPQRRVPLVHGDTFVCTGGVDVPRLLRASRASLLDKASLLGANVLVDESWTCTIRQPKMRRDGTYRVQVRYNASASRSNTTPDPQRPVALDKAKSVPGLMTILQREEFNP